MQLRKTGGGVAWARKEDYEWEGTKFEADLKTGDVVKIVTEPVIEMGEYKGVAKEQDVAIIETRNGEKKVNFNPKSLNALLGAFGDESKTWVGKEINVLAVKTIIGGEKRVIAYLVPDGYKLDDYGDLVKSFDPTQEQVSEDVLEEIIEA